LAAADGLDGFDLCLCVLCSHYPDKLRQPLAFVKKKIHLFSSFFSPP
jgi:hypothetical protein